MPQADPAQRVVDRREAGGNAAAALQLALEFGEHDIRFRLDQPFAVDLIRRQQRAPLAALARRCGAAGRAHPLHSLIAAEGLTAKRRAAARIELPRSTPRTMCRRRSMDMGAGMSTSRLVSTDIVESQV
jgi:hypothetical protein